MLIFGVIFLAVLILIHNVILRVQVRKRTILIEKAEKKYRQLIEDAYEGIAVSRGDKFVFVSPGMIRITGYSLSELVDSNRCLIIHPDDKHLLEERMKHLALDEYVSTTYQIRITTNIGEIKWLHVSSTAIEWEGELAELEIYGGYH